jgi:hypothetical protein
MRSWRGVGSAADQDGRAAISRHDIEHPLFGSLTAVNFSRIIFGNAAPLDHPATALPPSIHQPSSVQVSGPGSLFHSMPP